MAESEAEPAPADGGLLGELSGSVMRHPSAVSSDEELMRLASDPLLVRTFLQRRHAAPPTPAAPAGGRISLALACTTDMGGSAQTPPPHKSYERRDGLQEPSLSPTPFAPSREDREEAYDLGAALSASGPGKDHAPGVFLLAAVLLLGAVIWAAG